VPLSYAPTEEGDPSSSGSPHRPFVATAQHVRRWDEYGRGIWGRGLLLLELFLHWGDAFDGASIRMAI
jgi:hypothetical protein